MMIVHIGVNFKYFEYCEYW